MNIRRMLRPTFFKICTLALFSSLDLCALNLPSIKALLFTSGLTAVAGYHWANNRKQKPADYTINLMWINKESAHEFSFLNGKHKQEYVSNLLGWSMHHPKGTIHLWFDSATTSDRALSELQGLLKEQSKNYPNGSSIVLRDIRQLTHVKEHSNIFSDKIPVYFRSDLLRVIAGLEALKQNARKTYFVYADFDVAPLSPSKLFDKETKENLKKYGIVMTAGGHLGFENSFYILSADAPHMHTALERAIVELNTKRAYNALQGELYNVNRRRTRNALDNLPQIVYDSYPAMFKYFYHLQGLGTLKYFASDEPYDYHKHGLNQFGLKYVRWDQHLESNDKKLASYEVPVPTKKIECPPPSHQYR